MPMNKRESLIFTVMMCFVMVLGMSIYNAYLIQGQLSTNVFAQAWMGFPLTYIVAMALDLLLVSKIAKFIAFNYLVTAESPGIAKGMAMSICMVIPMVICMSLYGTFLGAMHTGIWSGLGLQWAKNIDMNIIVALPLQFIIAGPIVRKLFRFVFPVGTING